MADTNALVLRAQQRLAELKAAQAAKVASSEQQLRSNMITLSDQATHNGWRLDRSRPWNEQQMAAILSGMQGKSFCLIGAAGTGKTSTLKGLVNSLLDNSMLPIIRPYEETKWLHGGKPGIVLVSFTNMAVRQIAKHFSNDITCITIHKLLEFAPHFYEIDDPVTGEIRKTVRFEPNRNAMNPLPRTLRTIVVDESSMVSVELIELVCQAMAHLPQVQWIFLGDLNQIPPVMGKAILGRKLLELPVVELTEVYRQALESPIITLATNIKDGKSVPVADTIIDDRGVHGKVTIKTWSKPISAEDAVNKAANFCKAAIQQNLFDPITDIILVPHGKMLTNKGTEAFSSGQLNIRIADWLGRQRGAQVYEVVAGFETHYYAVGDKVLVNKREAIIEHIQWNRDYTGKRPLDSRKFDIDRWGGATKKSDPNVIDMDYGSDEMVASMDVDAILASMVAENTQIEDRVYQASHKIRVRFINGEDVSKWLPTDYEDEENTNWEGRTLSTAAEINDMLFAYAITVHKSQGSEWRRVFLMLHQSHSAQCSRELIYTAITRAASELLIICEPDRGMKVGTLSKAAKSPLIKGNTLAEKLQWLQEKAALAESENQDGDE